MIIFKFGLLAFFVFIGAIFGLKVDDDDSIVIEGVNK